MIGREEKNGGQETISNSVVSILKPIVQGFIEKKTTDEIFSKIANPRVNVELKNQLQTILQFWVLSQAYPNNGLTKTVSTALGINEKELTRMIGLFRIRCDIDRTNNETNLRAKTIKMLNEEIEVEQTKNERLTTLKKARKNRLLEILKARRADAR